ARKIWWAEIFDGKKLIYSCPERHRDEVVLRAKVTVFRGRLSTRAALRTNVAIVAALDRRSMPQFACALMAIRRSVRISSGLLFVKLNTSILQLRFNQVLISSHLVKF